MAEVLALLPHNNQAYTKVHNLMDIERYRPVQDRHSLDSIVLDMLLHTSLHNLQNTLQWQGPLASALEGEGVVLASLEQLVHCNKCPNNLVRMPEKKGSLLKLSTPIDCIIAHELWKLNILLDQIVVR